MGNIISSIKSKFPLKQFNPIHLSVSQRHKIIKYWFVKTRIKFELIPAELVDIITLYSHYIFRFIPENLYYKVSNSFLQATKVEASTHPMTHEHDAYPEWAGILFGGIFENDMRYYCKFQSVNPYKGPNDGMDAVNFRQTSIYLSRIQIALVDVNYEVGYKITARVGGLHNSYHDCCVALPLGRNTSMDVYNINHVLKISVDMKLKQFILFNETTMKELQRIEIKKNQCRLCFITIQRGTTLGILDQCWFK
eukprot:493569_1